MASLAPSRLLDITRIYAEQGALERPYGQQILARFPDAQIVPVEDQRRIPELYGDETNVARWVRIKQEALVVATLKSPRVRPNGRSADFIAPSSANGCAMACAYCYVPRRKGYSNPITVFTNGDQIRATLTRHVARQGEKSVPNQCDPQSWVYDLGENSDCSVDALLSDSVADSIALFRELPTAKASFATKYVNRQLLELDPQQRTRIRFSLMPAHLAKELDVRTSPVPERIAAINDFVAAGYEVHVNFSPVVITDGWKEAWAALLQEIDDVLSPAAKAQLAAEVIFLTHNEGLHEVNLGWHPRAEELLWRPDIQQLKRSESGQYNVRYRTGFKGSAVKELTALIAQHTPYCQVRYAF